MLRPSQAGVLDVGEGSRRWHWSNELVASGGNMDAEKIARLRQQAEHCRRLALGLSDERTINALLQMAQEYEEKAYQLDGK